MKLTYKSQVHEPYILELSSDELGLIRYHLSEAIEKLSSKSMFFKSYAELARKKGEPEADGKTQIWESSVRDLAEITKVKDDFEQLIKTLKYE